MNRKRLIFTWLILISLALSTSGCALIGTAITAGIAYGISQAVKD